MNAEEGVRFLQQEMNNKGIDKKLFGEKSVTFELRLFSGGPLYTKKDMKIIELRTEAGNSEFYTYDQQQKTFVKISDFQKSKGGYVIKYNNIEFTFVCSVGAGYVIVS